MLVDTEWVAELRDETGRADVLPLSSVFVLRRENDALRIVLYLNRQDIVAVIRARRASAVDPPKPDGAAH